MDKQDGTNSILNEAKAELNEFLKQLDKIKIKNDKYALDVLDDLKQVSEALYNRYKKATEKKEDMDLKDMATIAESFMDLRSCRGGRLVVEGLVCPHCRSGSPRTYCDWAKIGEKV